MSSYLEEKATPTSGEEELIKAAAASLYSGKSILPKAYSHALMLLQEEQTQYVLNSKKTFLI